MIDLEAIRKRSKQLCGMDSLELVRAVVADIDALLAEVEVVSPTDPGQPKMCMRCGLECSPRGHTIRECRDGLQRRLTSVQAALRTQMSVRTAWQERALRRGEQRDALLAEAGRLPRVEVSHSNLTAVCVICRRSVPVDAATPSVVNSPAYCVRPDCFEATSSE